MDEIVTLEIPDLPRYLTDILYQYQQGNHLCDCQIITNNGTIPAHSLVLLITCPFFNGTRNFISSQGMNFTVPFNIEDVGTVVRLLYTGKLTVSKNNIEQIVDICHYLQLKEALSLCQKYIQSVPCKEEITDIENSEERTDIGIGTLNLCQSAARTVDCTDSETKKNEESIDLPPFSNDHAIPDEKSNSRKETESYDGVSKAFDCVLKQTYSQHGLDIQDGITTVSCTKNFTTVHKTGTCNGSMEMYVTTESSQPSEEEGARSSKPDLLHNKEKNVSSQIYDDSHSASVSKGQDAESFKQQKTTFHNVTLSLVSLSSSSSSDLQNRNSSIEGIFRHGENRFENSCGDLNCHFATTCIKKETMDFDAGEFTVNNPVSAEGVSECMWNYPYDTGCNTYFTGQNPQFSGKNPQTIWNDPQSTGNIPQSTETDSELRNFEIQISEPPKTIAKKVKGGRKGKSEDVIEDENMKHIEAPALNKKSTKRQRKKREKEPKGQKGISNSDSVKNGRKRKGNQDSEETSVVLNNSVAHKIQTESDSPDAQSVQTEVTTSDKEKEKPETDKFSSVVYRCYICNYMFETKDELIKHRDENHPGKELGRLMYICDICGCTSVWDIHHVNHMYKKHNIPFDKNKYKLLSCHYEGCDYSTLLAFRLKQHIKNVHEFERKFTCETCGKSFKLKESLNAHAVVHRMGPDRIDFVCNICGKDFIRKGTLTKHMEYVHFKKPFTHICHYCDKSFQSKMKLVSHLFISHGETPIDYKVHDCDQCDFRCIYPSELRQHKALHQDCEGKLKCRFCDQTFSNKYSFESHEKRHSSQTQLSPTADRETSFLRVPIAQLSTTADWETSFLLALSIHSSTQHICLLRNLVPPSSERRTLNSAPLLTEKLRFSECLSLNSAPLLTGKPRFS
ncbi:hypothetical protein FSP39_025016 [Pinctada imbricata]|uniref:Uncharacterized protein n=1 Tax=Pinctada imbricata TaxID=66713 RepID=A0AA88XMA5_PINIB|nr:hypothetical protein FSP39_025016 [Pinctada imbricata]